MARLPQLSPVQRFALYSFIVVCILALLLGWGLSHYVGVALIRNAVYSTALAIQPMMTHELRLEDLSHPMEGERYQEFERVIATHIRSERAARIKIWNREGIVIYSDDPSLIGRRFPIEGELRRALDGEIAFDPSHLEKEENVAERRFGELLEVYVPLRVADSEEIVGTYEIYTYWQPIHDEIWTVRYLVWGSLAAGLAVLYLALFGVFRNATRTNLRLYQATERRVAELSALFEVSGALRGAATVEEMLPIILDKTLEVVAAEAGAIFLVDQAAGEMVVTVARGPMEEPLLGRRFLLTGSVTESLLHTGEPDISFDLAADPHMPEEMRAMLRGGESGIGLPLRAMGVPVGMMVVVWMTPHAVADDDVRLLTAIADMAASAIHRASLFEELERHVYELSALFEVGQAVTTSLRVQDVLSLVARVAPQALHAEGCYLFLWDEREERLVLRTSQGFLQEHVDRLKYRLGEGLSGWVFLEGKIANVPDVTVDPRWKHHPETEAVLPSGQVNSALVVPLVVRDKTLGVLGVVNKQRSRGKEEQTSERELSPAPLLPPIPLPAAKSASLAQFTAADESLLTTLAGQVAVAIENARLYEDVRELSLGAIRSLAAAVDARDPYTRGHSQEVTELTVRLARELGWRGADLELLECAALLHDVGKIAIPDAVLRKEGPLSAEEWNVIGLHPYHSAQIVKPVKGLHRIVPWVYHHQERWDGTGYPDGLRGDTIPLASRIIAVADAYNAMTTDRPYRQAMSHEEAMEELRRGAGTQLDPRVVEVFLQVLES